MKKLFLSLIAFCLTGLAFSQNFIQGVGVNTFIQSAPGFSSQLVGGVTYSPRVSFNETEDMSWSVGMPMSVGFSASLNTNSYDGSNTAALMVDAPLIVNFNYGAGCSRETENRFGFFAGGGVGYHMATYTEPDDYLYDQSYKMSGFGPVGNAGIRIGVGNGSHNIEIRFSYMKTLDVTKSNIFGIGGLFNF
jgi:hypothetical protein